VGDSRRPALTTQRPKTRKRPSSLKERALGAMTMDPNASDPSSLRFSDPCLSVFIRGPVSDSTSQCLNPA
jgi:hypothetical protein